MPQPVVEMLGRRFGRLLVIARAETPSRIRSKRAYWACDCDCGNRTIVVGSDLRNGGTTSCGCFSRERIVEVHTRHGMRSSAEYAAWRSMINRCLNESAINFVNYGGRGIRVCERWRAFEAFISDVGHRPTPEHSIDRIDNNGHYEPGNVRWATRMQQSRNRRTNRLIEIGNERMTIAEASARFGIRRDTLRARLEAGWSDELAVKTMTRRKAPQLERRKT